MKSFLSLFSILLVALFCVSCSDKKPTLYVYTWEGYMDPQVIELFEKENNCKVVVDTFASNEAMYAKIKSGAGGYDILGPSSYMAYTMYEQKMLEKLDRSLLPNVVANLDPLYDSLRIDKNLDYAVPLFISFTGIGYDKSKIKDFKPSWRMFERTDMKMKCALLDDHRETIGAALVTLGYSINSTKPEEIKAATELVLTWKKNIAKFGVDDIKQALGSGEFEMVHAYSGDMLQVMAENPNVAFCIPEEGGSVTIDNLAVASNAPNRELAYKFLDFLYRTDVATMNMNYAMYLQPQKEAVNQVEEELRKNPAFILPKAERDRCYPLQTLGEDIKLYNEAWDRIKAE